MTTRRVVRIITRLNIGGPSIQAIALSRDLTASGFDTLLIHGQLGEGEGSMTSLMPIAGHQSQYLDALRRAIAPFHDLRALWQMFRTLRRFKPQIVHTHMAKAGALGRLAAVLYNRTVPAADRARLVHTYHGHVFEGYFGSPSTRLFLRIERFMSRRSDALIAISPQIRRDIEETYRIGHGNNVRIVPLGFDLARFLAIDDSRRAAARRTLALPPDAFVVTTVGRLTAIKQHSLFLQMAERLAARHPTLTCLIVGDGELRAELEAEVQQRNLARVVRFLGWRGDLDVVYGATDVFVLTSRNEGTPVALIEAMASGVASVSTDVGGVRDVIAGPESGTLVPFGDADGLAAAVDRFAQSSELRHATGIAARSFVAGRFDLRRLLTDVSDLYRQLLAS